MYMYAINLTFTLIFILQTFHYFHFFISPQISCLIGMKEIIEDINGGFILFKTGNFGIGEFAICFLLGVQPSEPILDLRIMILKNRFKIRKCFQRV